MTLLWEPQIPQLRSKYDSSILKFKDVKRGYKNKLVEFPPKKKKKGGNIQICTMNKSTGDLNLPGCDAVTLKNVQFPSFLSTVMPSSPIHQTVRNYAPKQCSVTAQRAWIFNHITVRTSHLPSNHRHNTQERTTNTKYRDENSIKITAKIRSE